jgi:hypothetical protein
VAKNISNFLLGIKMAELQKRPDNYVCKYQVCNEYGMRTYALDRLIAKFGNEPDSIMVRGKHGAAAQAFVHAEIAAYIEKHTGKKPVLVDDGSGLFKPKPHSMATSWQCRLTVEFYKTQSRGIYAR